jgi:hypothetical protein
MRPPLSFGHDYPRSLAPSSLESSKTRERRTRGRSRRGPSFTLKPPSRAGRGPMARHVVMRQASRARDRSADARSCHASTNGDCASRRSRMRSTSWTPPPPPRWSSRRRPCGRMPAVSLGETRPTTTRTRVRVRVRRRRRSTNANRSWRSPAWSRCCALGVTSAPARWLSKLGARLRACARGLRRR